METTRFLRSLARSWWVLVITVIAGAAGGYLVFHQTTPLYASAVRLIVGVDGNNPVTNGVANEALASQLAAVAQTNPAATAAFNYAGSPTGGFNVASSASGSFVDISVTSTKSSTAARVANAYLATIKQSAASLSGSVGAYKLTTDFSADRAAAPYNLNRGRDVGIGLAAGLALGLALAILREALNRTVLDSDALHDLTALAVFGTVPLDSAHDEMPARSEPRSARAEAYRQIRTSILTRTMKRPLVVAVTSAVAGEGRTSVATNLAVVFSRAGHRVAIIDADLRHPHVHASFGLSPAVGLSDVLMGSAELEDALIELDGMALGVVPSGYVPDNPSELLGSEAMAAVLRTVSESYEIVIVDTPPVLPVTDALIVGLMTDGVLFVSKLKHTTSDRIVKALQAIDQVNAETLGVVANEATQHNDIFGRTRSSEFSKVDGSQLNEPHSAIVPASRPPARPSPTTSRLPPRHREQKEAGLLGSADHGIELGSSPIRDNADGA